MLSYYLWKLIFWIMGATIFGVVLLAVVVTGVFLGVFVANAIGRLRDEVSMLKKDVLVDGSFSVLLNDLACESVNGKLSESVDVLMSYMSRKNKERFMAYRDSYIELCRKAGYPIPGIITKENEKGESGNESFLNAYPKK